MALNKDVLAALILTRLRDAFPGFPFPPNDTAWVPIASALVDHIAGNMRVLLNVQRFTADGTYTPTPGTTLVRGQLVGSGGGGGSATTTNGCAGTGGGSGEFVSFLIDGGGVPIVGGAVTIGAAVSAGNQGNDTSVTINGDTITGQGGGAGVSVSSVAGGHANPAPTLGAVGVTTYDLFRHADRGQPNFFVSSIYLGGNGAAGLLGCSGTGANGGNTNGGAGQGFGAGGGGACRSTLNRTGGPSAPGVLILEEYGA